MPDSTIRVTIGCPGNHTETVVVPVEGRPLALTEAIVKLKQAAMDVINGLMHANELDVDDDPIDLMEENVLEGDGGDEPAKKVDKKQGGHKRKKGTQGV